jgi:hypothetical protein
MITWKINGLKVAQTPQPNTVTDVNYTATHANGPTQSGTVTFGPPRQPFIAYADLTEEAIVNWLGDFVNKDAIQAILNARAAQTEPKSLPWRI